MLPLHIAREDGYKSIARRWFGRPLARWFGLFAVGAVFLWFVSTILFDFENPWRLLPPPPPRFPEVILDIPTRPRPAPPSAHDSLWSQRALRVRDAYVHAYNGYKRFAFGYDELLPLSAHQVNNFNGWGVSMIDSLDTMWIMGLHDEFDASIHAVAQLNFTQKDTDFAPFFETVIRYLGGLLSAYALSGETVLLARADDLGRKLLPAFNTPSGLPRYGVNTVTGKTSLGWTGGSVLWAEATSCQMEYKYLAHLTGRADYYHTVESVMKGMYTANVTDGLFPSRWEPQRATPMDAHLSIGAAADSGYEYFLKQFLLSGRSELDARDQYIRSVNGVIKNLVYISPNRSLLYVTDTQNGKPSHILEHLSCFFPGLLALGVHTLAELSPQDRELHLWAAQGLAYTCWMTYADQATGFGADTVSFNSSSTLWLKHVKQWESEGRPGGVPPGLDEVPTEPAGRRDYVNSSPVYLLRPETVETFFILWKTTGDIRWRERGWAVFDALEKHSRTTNGFASIAYVDQVPTRLNDDMPSYFLAETLKYLYLLFYEGDLIPLDKWVFNTEAHPLPIFQWTSWEKEEYGIP